MDFIAGRPDLRKKYLLKKYIYLKTHRDQKPCKILQVRHPSYKSLV